MKKRRESGFVWLRDGLEVSRSVELVLIRIEAHWEVGWS